MRELETVRFIGDSGSLFPNLLTATIEEAVETLSKMSIVGVDTETEGFNFIDKKLLMLQIGNSDIQYVVDTRCFSKEQLMMFKEILEDDLISKIFHNAKFDYKFIKKYVGASTRNIYDTYLTEKVLHCGKDGYGFGLDKLCKRYLDVDLNKNIRNRFVGLSGAPFTIDQIVYGAKDVEYLEQIYKLQQPDIDAKQLRNVVVLENKAVEVFSEIEYEGLIIDLEPWKVMSLNNIKEAREYEKKLDKVLFKGGDQFNKYKAKKQLDLFLPVEELKESTINWGSPTQVFKLFQELIPDLENVNGKKLAPYKSKFPIIAEYIKFKEKDKLASAFGDNFNDFIDSDGRVRTTFQQILDTGRVSSSEPNMQQIPARNEYRNCFVAPKGYVFVSSDYSSQELNVIAYGSQDPVFMEALKNNQDLHSVCAELVFQDVWTNAAEEDCAYVRSKEKCECKVHKKLRTQVKTVNFGLAYGMGPKKLSETIDCDLKEAKDLITKYFKAFPKIKVFLDRLGEFGKKHGYIETFPPFKRKRWFVNWTPKMYNDESKFMELGSIERASKNTPIQGSSADMTKLALVYIYEFIRKNNLPVKIVMTVHDQIDTITAVEYAEEWKVKMTELMEKAAKVVITNGLLKADTQITDKWSK
jgi:DNA polymerase-1